MVKNIFPELRLDVPSIEKHITPNMLCLRDIEVMLRLQFEPYVSKLKMVIVYIHANHKSFFYPQGLIYFMHI